jgi:AraC-like DNA-binding protein/multisubunit Na+/H+ antiporter MnhG subunit
MNSVINILLFIGGAQGLLLSTALFSVNRGNRKANRVLAVLLLLFSSLIISHAIGHSHTHGSVSYTHRWMVHAIFLTVGPLLFFYSKALTQYDFKLHLRDSLHFLPAILSCAIILYIGDISRTQEFTALVDLVILLLIAVQMSVYLVCMLVILNRYTRLMKDTYSSIEKLKLHWLRFFVISQTVIWPIAFIIDLYWHSTGDIGSIWLIISAFIYFIGYIGLLRPEIFSGELQGERPSVKSEKKKYEKSALSPEQAETILQRLNVFMESSKPYIIPTLTLPALSKEMNISPHHLSQVINEKTNKNFFEFINYFRVEEAKRLLKDREKQNLTLAAIGFEAGFNSVSSFNSIFKKVTSITPSQYRLSGSSTP